MYYVEGGLTFKDNEDGSIIILRNGGIISTLTKDAWVSLITHMAKENRPLNEIHNIAEKFHTGDLALKI